MKEHKTLTDKEVIGRADSRDLIRELKERGYIVDNDLDKFDDEVLVEELEDRGYFVTLMDDIGQRNEYILRDFISRNGGSGMFSPTDIVEFIKNWTTTNIAETIYIARSKS